MPISTISCRYRLIYVHNWSCPYFTLISSISIRIFTQLLLAVKTVGIWTRHIYTLCRYWRYRIDIDSPMSPTESTYTLSRYRWYWYHIDIDLHIYTTKAVVLGITVPCVNIDNVVSISIRICPQLKLLRHWTFVQGIFIPCVNVDEIASISFNNR